MEELFVGALIYAIAFPVIYVKWLISGEKEDFDVYWEKNKKKGLLIGIIIIVAIACSLIFYNN